MRLPPSHATIVFAAIFLGCGADLPAEVPAVEGPPAAGTSSAYDPAEAAAVAPPPPNPPSGAGAELPAVQIRPHSVEELLRLPSKQKVGEKSPVSILPESTGDVTDPLERRGERRVRVDFETQTDRGVVPGSEKTQTDVGVSLGVGERTRLRAGVRVEEEDEDREETPTLGVERKF